MTSNRPPKRLLPATLTNDYDTFPATASCGRKIAPELEAELAG